MTTRPALPIVSSHRPDLTEKIGLALTRLKSNAFEGRKVSVLKSGDLSGSLVSLAHRTLSGFVYVIFAAVIEPMDIVGRVILSCSSTHTKAALAYLKVQSHENAKFKLQRLCDLALRPAVEDQKSAKDALKEAIKSSSLEALWGTLKKASSDARNLFIELMEDSKLQDLVSPHLTLQEGKVRLLLKELNCAHELSNKKLALLISHEVDTSYPNADLLRTLPENRQCAVFNEEAFNIASLKEIDYAAMSYNALLENEQIAALFNAVDKQSSQGAQAAKAAFNAALDVKAEIKQKAQAQFEDHKAKIQASWSNNSSDLEELLRPPEFSGAVIAQIYIDSDDQDLDIFLALDKMPEEKRDDFVAALNKADIKPDFSNLLNKDTSIALACARHPQYQKPVLKVIWQSVPEHLAKDTKEEKEAQLATRFRSLKEVKRLGVFLNDLTIATTSIIDVGAKMPNKLSLALTLMTEERCAQLMNQCAADKKLTSDYFALKNVGTKSDPADLTLPLHLAKEAQGKYVSFSPEPFSIIQELDLHMIVNYLTPAGVVSRLILGEGVKHSRFDHLNWMDPKALLNALGCSACPKDIFSAGKFHFSDRQKSEILLGWKIELVAAYALSSKARLEETLSVYTEPTRRKALIDQLYSTLNLPALTTLVTQEELKESTSREIPDYTQQVKDYTNQLKEGSEVDSELNALPIWALQTIGHNLKKDPEAYVRLVKALKPESRVWIFSELGLFPPADARLCEQLTQPIQEALEFIDQLTHEEQKRAYPCARPDLNESDVCLTMCRHLFCHFTSDLEFPFAPLFIERYSSNNRTKLFELLKGSSFEATYDVRFDVPTQTPRRLIQLLSLLGPDPDDTPVNTPAPTPVKSKGAAAAEEPKTPLPKATKAPSKQQISKAFYETVFSQLAPETYKDFVDSLCARDGDKYTLGDLVTSLASSDNDKCGPLLIAALETGHQHIPLDSLRILFSTDTGASLLQKYGVGSPERAIIIEVFASYLLQLSEVDGSFWIPSALQDADNGFLASLNSFLISHLDTYSPLVRKLSAKVEVVSQFAEAYATSKLTDEQVATYRATLSNPDALGSSLPWLATVPTEAMPALFSPLKDRATEAALTRPPKTPGVPKDQHERSERPSSPSEAAARALHLRLVIRKIIDSKLQDSQVIDIINAVKCRNVMILALRELTRSSRLTNITVLKAVLPDAFTLLNHDIVKGLSSQEAFVAVVEWLQDNMKYEELKEVLAPCGTYGMPEFNWLATANLNQDTAEIVMASGKDVHNEQGSSRKMQKVQLLLGLLQGNLGGFKLVWKASSQCPDVVESFKACLQGETLALCLKQFASTPRHTLFLEVVDRLLLKAGEISKLVQREEVDLGHLEQVALAFKNSLFLKGDFPGFISAVLPRFKKDLKAEETIRQMLLWFKGSESHLIRALGQRPELHHLIGHIAQHGTSEQLSAYINYLSPEQEAYLAPHIDQFFLEDIGEAYTQVTCRKLRLGELATTLRKAKWDQSDVEYILEKLMRELYQKPTQPQPLSPTTPVRSKPSPSLSDSGTSTMIGDSPEQVPMDLTPPRGKISVEEPLPSTPGRLVRQLQTPKQDMSAQSRKAPINSKELYQDILNLSPSDIALQLANSEDPKMVERLIQVGIEGSSFKEISGLIDESLTTNKSLCYQIILEVLKCESPEDKSRIIPTDLALKLIEEYTNRASGKLSTELSPLNKLVILG